MCGDVTDDLGAVEVVNALTHTLAQSREFPALVELIFQVEMGLPTLSNTLLGAFAHQRFPRVKEE
jgi:hypothetical protein